jgi:hypothetical protein
MGFHLDVTVEKEYIDHGYDGKLYYHEEVNMTGNGICDTICIKQGEDVIGMSVTQFQDLIQQLRGTSFWCYAALDYNKLGESPQ